MRRFVVLVALIAICSILNAQSVERIVSLVPSLTDNIYLIGGQKKLIGCTSYCLPAIKDGIQQVGSTVNANTEVILSLKPDLVLASKLTKPQDIASLEKLGVKVEMFDTPRSFDDICSQTMKLAYLLNCEPKAEKVVANAKRRVAEIRERCKNRPSSKVFIQIGANPIFTVIEDSFLNDYITFCNAENIAKDLTSGTISREVVVARNPDVIVIAEMGGFGQHEKGVWLKYPVVSAVQNKRVFLISSETSCNPSPANFVSALEDIYKYIYE